MKRVYREKLMEESLWRSISNTLRPRSCSEVEFHHCHFQGWGFSETTKVEHRSKMRYIVFQDCEETGCSIGPAIIEEITVDGLETNTLLQIWGAVCRHVTIKGRIGEIMFSPLISPLPKNASWQKSFDEANEAYYRSVDWALDIRRAEFRDVDLNAIPGKLIKRDSDTQVLVTRDKAADGRWRNLPLSKTYWPTSLEFFLRRGRDSIVLVAPKRAADFRVLLEGLQLLRREGIAEPD